MLLAKAALLAYSRNLREELKPHQVAVTAILLGPTLTDSWKDAPYPPERFIQGEAVADLIWAMAHLPPGTVVRRNPHPPYAGGYISAITGQITFPLPPPSWQAIQSRPEAPGVPSQVTAVGAFRKRGTSRRISPYHLIIKGQRLHGSPPRQRKPP